MIDLNNADGSFFSFFVFPSCSKHGASTDSGTKITADYIDKILNEEAKKVKGVPDGQLETARKYMSAQVSFCVFVFIWLFSADMLT